MSSTSGRTWWAGRASPCAAPPGTTVTLAHAEMLSDDGTVYTDNLRGAQQTDRYTLRGGATAPETFEPHFTYHGFRYVQVTGLAVQASSHRPRRSAGQLGAGGGEHLRDVVAADHEAVAERALDAARQHDRHSDRLSAARRAPRVDGRHPGLQRHEHLQRRHGRVLHQVDADVRDAQTPDGRFADFSPQPFQQTLAETKARRLHGRARLGRRRRRRAVASLAAVRRPAAARGRTTTRPSDGSSSFAATIRTCSGRTSAATTTATG